MKKFLILSTLISLLGCSDDTLNPNDSTDGDSKTDGASTICGDGVCDADENSSTCSSDCFSDWTHISLGVIHTCGIYNNGELFCWGKNLHGSGNRSYSGTSTYIPIRIGTDSDWTHVSLGYIHTCGIHNGKLFCWSDNTHGQLGDGTHEYREVPTRIGTDSDWTHISLGYDHTCGIRNNGELFCWGDNIFGQLGDGTNGVDGYDHSTDKKFPTRIGVNSDWTHILSGYKHTCGLRNNGELFCWGSNSHGQLGDGTNGTYDDKNIPTRIGINSDWTDISPGEYHTCGIRNNGELFCWGSNSHGQLGNGTNEDKNIPNRVGDNFDWTHTSLGFNHTCGIHSGELFCWGKNTYGQLGDGTNGDGYDNNSADKSIPTRIGINFDWTHTLLGKNYTCGFRDHGKLFCWGNNNGRLGNGTDVNTNTPTLIDTF